MRGFFYACIFPNRHSCVALAETGICSTLLAPIQQIPVELE
jgi:hypothetical protein